MPNDLEEFLRQAAAMRQQKSVQQRAEAERQREQQAPARARPYTNAKQERVVDAAHVDDGDEQTGLGIEILEDQPKRPQGSQSRPSSGRPADTSHASRATLQSTSSSNLANELRKMLARPEGVRQAFLVREILNRPRF